MGVAPKLIGELTNASVARARRVFSFLGVSRVEAVGARPRREPRGIGMKGVFAGVAAPALVRLYREGKGVGPVRKPASWTRSASVFGYRCLLLGGGVPR